MKGIILAAGKSSRLYPVTLKKPKCLLELEKGKTIIDFQIEILKKCGVDDVIVVVGYLQNEIVGHLGNSVRYRVFEDFDKYNNLHTLYSVKDEFNEDLIILYSDVLCTRSLLKRCVDSVEDFCLLVHNTSILINTARVKIKNEGVVDVGNHISLDESDGNFIGIAKFSQRGIASLLEAIEQGIGDVRNDNAYYIMPIRELAKAMHIGYVLAHHEPWCEIDILEDYERAKEAIYPRIKALSSL